jgi:hypothetical protein
VISWQQRQRPGLRSPRRLRLGLMGRLLEVTVTSHLAVWITSFSFLGIVTKTLGDPAQGQLRTVVAPAPTPYSVVNRIGVTPEQIALGENKLLVHSRATDPFGIPIRDKFKGLPPAATPAPTANSSIVKNAAQPDVLTLEKTIQRLRIGGIDISRHEALIGPRSVHEGDFLVLELSGHRFAVWVETVDRRGVLFCDVNLQKHLVKPFRFGPAELPGETAKTTENIRDFLKQDVH